MYSHVLLFNETQVDCGTACHWRCVAHCWPLPGKPCKFAVQTGSNSTVQVSGNTGQQLQQRQRDKGSQGCPQGLSLDATPFQAHSPLRVSTAAAS
jgi:hypothetical protein